MLKTAIATVAVLVAGLVGLVILGSLVLVLVWDWNYVRGIVNDRGSAATGRDFAVEGDIDVDLTWPPRVTLNDIRLGNPDWASDPNMAEIETLTFIIAVLDLLVGRVNLPELTIAAPHLSLEQTADGTANWTFTPLDAAAPEDRDSFPIIGRLRIDDGFLRYRDAARNIDLESRLATVRGDGGDGDDRIELSGTGTLEGRAFELSVLAGALLTLRDEDVPYPLDADLTVGPTRVQASGTLTAPLQLTGMDMELTLSGQDAGDLFPIFGVPVPDTPPYDVSGRLTRDGAVWSFSDFSGNVGDSDLAGVLSFDTSGDRLFISGDLTSSVLDFDDLGPIVGAPVATGEGETASDTQKEIAAAYGQREQLLPDAPIDFARVRSVDAEIAFKGESIVAPGLPLDTVELQLDLKDGVLKLEPVTVGVAGGQVTADIEINAQKDEVASWYNVRLRGFRLESFIPDGHAVGEIVGRAQVQALGNSVAEAAGNADGEVSLILEDGEISNLAVELIGLDVMESLGILAAEESGRAPIRCAIASFSIDQGVGTAQALVIDTADSTVTGEGTIDLDTETVDLELLAHPKDPSLFSARAPIHVEGSFRAVSVTPDAAALAVRILAAAALGVVLTPVASALAFVEPGFGEDSNCQALTRQAEQ